MSDVEREGKDEQEKRQKALQKWKEKFGFKATYRKLVEVLLSLSMADTAEKICHILKGSYRYMGCLCAYTCVCVCVYGCGWVGGWVCRWVHETCLYVLYTCI